MGSETRIEDCNHEGWDTNNCGHEEDLSISCIPSNDILLIRHNSKQQIKGHSGPCVFLVFFSELILLFFFNITEDKSVTWFLIKQCILLTRIFYSKLFIVTLHLYLRAQH